MKHLAAVSALIIATDNAVISTEARVARMIIAVNDFLDIYDRSSVGVTIQSRHNLDRALDDLATISGDVRGAHELAVVLAYDLFNEASEDYR